MRRPASVNDARQKTSKRYVACAADQREAHATRDPLLPRKGFRFFLSETARPPWPCRLLPFLSVRLSLPLPSALGNVCLPCPSGSVRAGAAISATNSPAFQTHERSHPGPAVCGPHRKSMPLPCPFSGFAAAAHKLPHSPITGAAAPPASAPPRSPPAAWLPAPGSVPPALIPTAVNHCPLQTAPKCNARSSPAGTATVRSPLS